MKELTRTKVDNFDISNSLNLEALSIENINKNIISIEEVFKHNQTIELNDKDLELFLNGVMLTTKLDENVYRVYNDKKFIGLGIIKNNLLKRDVIL